VVEHAHVRHGNGSSQCDCDGRVAAVGGAQQGAEQLGQRPWEPHEKHDPGREPLVRRHRLGLNRADLLMDLAEGLVIGAPNDVDHRGARPADLPLDHQGHIDVVKHNQVLGKRE